MLALSMRPLADQRVQVFTRLNYMERYAPLFQRRVLFALLPSMFWNTANLTSYTYLGARLAEQHSPKTVIFLFFVYGVGGLTGSQIGGRVLDRFGATIPLVTCLAVAAINQALMEVSSLSTITTAFALALWSISGWATFAPQQARLISLSPHNSALLIAVNHSIIYIGFATGAAIGGAAIAHGVNVSQLHWVTTILLVAALLIFLLGVKREKAFCFSSPD
jgi:predicted MFS family arabinose efflux permease